MGRSDDSGDGRRSKKKRKRKDRSRERTRSSSVSSDTSRYSSSRHKKSKKKHHSRYRSPTPERRRRKRSSSRSRRRSRSSDSYYRRSPSEARSRSRYSRSRSRDRRSRSRSYDRRGRRSRSRDRRSPSYDRQDSQRSSVERRRDDIRGLSLSEPQVEKTPAQLAEERLKAALKAAEAADEKLRQSSMGGEFRLDSPRLGDSGDFSSRVKDIESDRFVPSSFISSSSSKSSAKGGDSVSGDVSHDAAIFGSLSTEGFVIQPDTQPMTVKWDTDNLIHPSLFCDVEEKMDRWIERLTQLRKRKLEGEAY